MNVAEHFPLVLSPEIAEELLLSAAFPYLAAGANNLLLEIFEAAHSLVLVAFAIPHNSELAAKHLPFYIENLFAVKFPVSSHWSLSLTVYRFSPTTFPHVNSALPLRPLYKSQHLLPP